MRDKTLFQTSHYQWCFNQPKKSLSSVDHKNGINSFNCGYIFISYTFKSKATFMSCINAKAGFKVNAKIRILPVTHTWKILHWLLNIFLTDLPCLWQQRPSLCKHFLLNSEEKLTKPPTVLPAHTQSIRILWGGIMKHFLISPLSFVIHLTMALYLSSNYFCINHLLLNQVWKFGIAL